LSSTAGYKAWAVEGHRTVGYSRRVALSIRFDSENRHPADSAVAMDHGFRNARDFNMMQERAD